ncbi:Wzz/FepE/Etk N-terminal domain-containing protein [Pseudomonas sp. M2]|uniref:LPS O-antigen chain length determinant protein WzzB n=1 Tax=Pseudomonas sp. M2 TaxID=228756 RepID=UPI0018CA17D3|nr:Wzz/FepE/Etk N-terminal domain-containing protein [Pseudomonas sp. M2]MBG6124171.1 chain length determinant protein (polysaccharide antigen chain regulator) [Pseudomonas sp. M2]HDS1748015.1 LPS O-antigen chain length determinant protein WzzB [Pseudomonas putida]
MRNEHEDLRRGEEIGLFELLQGAWRQKFWMAVVAIPVLAIGLAYVLIAKPVYEAKIYVQPPSQNDIAQLNFGRGGDTGLSVWGVKDVYEVFVRKLQSEALRNNFFRHVYLPSLPESERKASWDVLYRDYARAVGVSLAAKDTPTRYVITVEVEDPQRAADWVARYAEMASSLAKEEVLKSNRSEMLVKADNIEQQIAGTRSAARKERDDKIARLKEALIVARAIGLKKPPLISGALSTEVSAGMAGSLSYMRGSDALETEIANLESRPSDDPFIKGLRRLQLSADLYRNLQVSDEVISVYQQDGAVDQPETPVRPRKTLILVLTALIALVLGGFTAIARGQWVRIRGGGRVY